MRARFLGTGLGVVFSVACAAGSGQGPTSTTATPNGKSDSKLICREETPTGSMFSRTVCRTPEQVDGERTEGQDFLRNQRGRPEPQPGGAR